MDKKFKKILKANGYIHLFEEIENIKPSQANLIAKGIELVSNNWDCAPNGGTLDYIVEYLNQKHDDYLIECSTRLGILIFKNNEWFFKWSDLIFSGMSDEYFMFTPIITEGLDISELENNQPARCIVETEYDTTTFAPIFKARFKRIVKNEINKK